MKTRRQRTRTRDQVKKKIYKGQHEKYRHIYVEDNSFWYKDQFKTQMP
jgi:hypothetical protein